jgi:ComF family protein
MAPRRGRQYIDLMLSAPFSWATRLRHLQALQLLPSQCLLCHSWQQDSICTTCLTRWRVPMPRCPRCAIDLPVGFRGDVCVQCEDQSPEFDRAIAALDYTAPWSPLLARLKFQGDTALARPLSRLLAQAVAPRLGRINLVLPVPLSSQRLMERGYNQSWLIARHLGKQLGVKVRHDLLVRTRHTSRMMTLSAEERQAHIRGAFQLTKAGQQALEGRDVAVVDDVMTTGATLNAISQVLQEGGARSVSAWVVARTPAPLTMRAAREQA